MSTTSSPFRVRRPFGRAPSPPTWACYEQIPYDEDDSDTGSEEVDSGSESYDDCQSQDSYSDSEREDNDSGERRGAGNPCDSSDSDAHPGDNVRSDVSQKTQAEKDGMEVDDVNGDGQANDSECPDEKTNSENAKDIKGKQRAVEPEVVDPPKRRHRKRKHREPVYTLRPILTIHKSQGFVWNQDLFVPPYIKDRYIASTSPPNSHGSICYPISSLNSLNDYEVDVVEIRVKEGELADYIP